ncbi:MAG: hypothetical protein OEV23_04280 [Gallionella sp.]|nr:hypothetical protein [Gallionella sp.]
MDSAKAGNAPDSFVRQMLHNKMLMLTVLLATAAVAYFCVGLYMMLVR